jgi:malonyl-CoA O-methyltransferase
MERVVALESTRVATDTARLQRLFGRRRLLDADDFLQREVARRMMERLSTVRIDATRVLDLGCGSGADHEALRARFEDASICGLDLVMSRLRILRQRSPQTGVIARWLRRDAASLAVQADFAALPFAAQSVDVLWSNLALHWHAEPHRVLPEWSRVARIGGLVAFSAFGPDTLREVGDAFRAVDENAHVMPFTDMHDYGDMLVASGFTTPVVDMERLTLTYSTAASLWSDVRALGGNPLPATRGLRGRRFKERLDAALDATRDADGRYQLTFELIFAHAWKGEPRKTRDGETIVRVTRGLQAPGA